jgi:hypothetical protein
MNLRSMRNRQPLRDCAVGLALVAFAALAAAPAPGHALPIGWNVFGGWATEADGLVLGAGAHFGVGPIEANPNAEMIFIDHGNMFTLNADAHWTVLPAAVANVFVGGGVGMVILDPEQGDSDTDAGINLIVGATLNAVRFNPFGKLKWVVIDGGDPFIIEFGIRF